MAASLEGALVPRMVERFGRTERALHWVHATGFFAMLATGLVLYLPVLSELVARRNLVKNVHIFSAVAWAIAIALVVAIGDRRRLAADWREIEGRQLPFKQTITIDGEPLATVTVESLEVNPALEPALFEVPKS